MTSTKYIGLDVHKESISIAVLNSAGKVVMNRLKALYRSWAIPCAGTQVYAPRYRSEWLSKITEAGVHRRAELYYQQLDALRLVRQQARKELLAEARKHRATKWLRQIPGIGPLRAAHLVAVMQTPHRFRTKRQLWTIEWMTVRLDVSETNGAVATRVWNHREEETFLRFTRRNEISDSLSKTTLESRVHVQTVGLNAEQSIGIEPKRRYFS